MTGIFGEIIDCGTASDQRDIFLVADKVYCGNGSEKRIKQNSYLCHNYNYLDL